MPAHITRLARDARQKEILRLFDEACYGQTRWQTWADFIMLAAISISNAVDNSHAEEREKTYMSIASKYKPRALDNFAKMFAAIVETMDANPDQDCLGELYMGLELGNQKNGQFFTPYHVCQMMARMSNDDLKGKIEAQGWVSVNDCACGAGATLIAFANECMLRDNPAAEYLFKCGMPRLAVEADRLGANLDCDRPSFFNVMGVSGQYMEIYRTMDVSSSEHRLIRAYGKWVSREDLQALRALKVPDDCINTAISILRNMSITRFVNYFSKQKKITKRSMNNLLIEYRDYLDMSTALGVDFTHKAVRFPVNIVDAHNQIVPRFNKIKDAVADETFKAAIGPLYENLRITQFEQAGLCIVLPQLRSDLIAEGQSLNHCVGQDKYYKNHINGTSMIFFVRKSTDPKKPFFTMEVDMIDYHIVQLYGFGDCSAPKEVRRFAEAYVRRLRPGVERRAS